MRHLIFSTALVISLIFTPTLYAAPFTPTVYATTSVFPPKPAACPSVSALQGAGVQSFRVVRGSTNAQLLMPFQTADNWQYIIGTFDGNWTDQKILDTAKSILPAMTFVNGPFKFYNTWMCRYDLPDDYVAFTMIVVK